MSVNEHVGVGEEVEALLRNELSVEPSPAFLPRVRERIAAVPQQTWRSHRVLAGIAAAVCIVAIGAEILYRNSTLPPATPPAPLFAKAPAQPAGGRFEPQRRTSARAQARRQAVTNPRAAVAAAEVIVDQRQLAALSVLMKMIDNGRITDKTFAHTKPQSLDPIREQIVPVGVAPMSVNRLEFDGVLQKGTERK